MVHVSAAGPCRSQIAWHCSRESRNSNDLLCVMGLRCVARCCTVLRSGSKHGQTFSEQERSRRRAQNGSHGALESRLERNQTQPATPSPGAQDGFCTTSSVVLSHNSSGSLTSSCGSSRTWDGHWTRPLPFAPRFATPVQESSLDTLSLCLYFSSSPNEMR